MAYQINITVMVYGGGNSLMESALADALLWIRQNTQFEPVVTRVNSTAIITPIVWPGGNGGYWIDPGALPWNEIPPALFTLVLWDNDNLPIAFGGTVWNPFPWNGAFYTALFATPYNFNPLYTGPGIEPQLPYQGFNTLLEQRIIHEFKNTVYAWLHNVYGYNILDTYEDTIFIDCALYTNFSFCYRYGFFSQLNDEMYSRLGVQLPPPAASDRLTPISALAFLSLLAVGLVTTGGG